jgi:hypothetical protein
MWSSKSSLGAVLLVSATCLVGASPAHAQASDFTSPAAVSLPSNVPRARSNLVWSGASLFALSYLASSLAATTGYSADDGLSSTRTPLWVPAVGPFVMMGSASSVGAEVLLALDGLAQIGGLTMFIYGLASPKMTHASEGTKTSFVISIAPLLAPGAPGAALVARF